MYDKIRSRATYTERDVAEVVRQIMSAVRYMHQNHVCHRDLKPENLLCEGAVDEFRIKVADFGISRMYKVGEDMSTVCGSPEYVGLSPPGASFSHPPPPSPPCFVLFFCITVVGTACAGAGAQHPRCFSPSRTPRLSTSGTWASWHTPCLSHSTLCACMHWL